MEQIVSQMISQFGVLGVVLVAAGWLLYNDIKDRKDDKKSNKDISSKLDDIVCLVQNQDARITGIESRLDERIDRVIEAIHTQPTDIVGAINDRDKERSDRHNLAMSEQIKLAPKIHSILQTYKSLINCDHILLATFHNGTMSMSGLPYYKFDIISERFTPELNQDTEFAPMYQNVDILRHDKLPLILTQNGYANYVIDENGCSELEDHDNSIFCRAKARGVKQISFLIINDETHRPAGFICALRYDYKEMNLAEFRHCSVELEKLLVETPSSN